MHLFLLTELEMYEAVKNKLRSNVMSVTMLVEFRYDWEKEFVSLVAENCLFYKVPWRVLSTWDLWSRGFNNAFQQERNICFMTYFPVWWLAFRHTVSWKLIMHISESSEVTCHKGRQDLWSWSSNWLGRSQGSGHPGWRTSWWDNIRSGAWAQASNEIHYFGQRLLVWKCH